MEKNLFPRPEHPQPMFKRDNWQNLNGEWLFEFDFGTSGAERRLFKPESAEEYTKKIKVPFCPESELSGIGYKDFIPAVWYKRSITVTEEQLKGRVLLHFGAVDYACDIYINGKKRRLCALCGAACSERKLLLVFRIVLCDNYIYTFRIKFFRRFCLWIINVQLSLPQVREQE